MRLQSALALLVVAVHHAQAFIPFHAITTRQSSFSARSPIQRSFAARKGPGDVKEQQIGVPTIFRELLGNTSPADAEEEDEETTARKAVQEQQKQLERLDQPPQAPIPLPSKPNMVMIGFGVAVAMVSYISSPQWDVDR